MNHVQNHVKPFSHHAIASLPGNIMRLARNAGDLILKSRPAKNTKTLPGFITWSLQEAGKEWGFNYHFSNETETDFVIPVKKERLLRSILALQLHAIDCYENVSMIIVRLQPQAGGVLFTINTISITSCTYVLNPAPGFYKLQQRTLQMGGRFQHALEPGSGSMLEVFLPL